MHPRLEDILAYLAKVRADLAHVLASTPKAALTHHPSKDAWSGAEIVHHLGHVEGASTKMLEGLFSKALAEGLPLDTRTGSLLRSLDRFQVPDRSAGRIKAPERLHPPRDADLDRAWESLQRVRERTLRAVATVDGRDLSKLSAPHPVFGPLDGYQWVLIIGQHEERHLHQLEENLAST